MLQLLSVVVHQYQGPSLHVPCSRWCWRLQISWTLYGIIVTQLGDENNVVRPAARQLHAVWLLCTAHNVSLTCRACTTLAAFIPLIALQGS